MILPPEIYSESVAGALRQGEIISNIEVANLRVESFDENGLEIYLLTYQYAIVVSQSCDLDWDWNAREGQGNPGKLLTSVLFCEVGLASEVKAERGLTSRLWKDVSRNNNERYHFFEQVKKVDDAMRKGLPELMADFKRYFSVPADEVYKRINRRDYHRRCALQSPYLEHFASRYHYFQSRVALPNPHQSE